MTQTSGDNPSDCLFCRWVAQGKAVAECGTVAAFNDGFPVTPGHLLIVPKRHVADGLYLNRQEIRDSEELTRLLVEQIRRDDPGVTGFNIGINIGQSAGQTVMHAHIHLIPRRDGDTDDPKGGVRGVIKGKRGY
ncbi:HIT family protein [uncultured Desulfosarcina sp.]|uniref:HIT family protein n=1 Tax=uncultured Desulfosarcina sp. TaxID=218289 RepID=UPI0029C90D9D|nr:HIT family protein [uncultured Desulfosarcina sp.]